MSEDSLKMLSDMVSDVHARIQASHEHINPVVEVRRGMRDAGIPADVLTIDCLRTRRRIITMAGSDHRNLLNKQNFLLK